MSQPEKLLKEALSGLFDKQIDKKIAPLKREIEKLKREAEDLRRRQGQTPASRGKVPRVSSRSRKPTGKSAREAASVPTAEQIRENRERLLLSQAELAQLTGVSSVSVYYWESGRTNPSGKRLDILNQLRQKSPDEVKTMLGKVEEPKEPKKKKSTKKKSTKSRKKTSKKKP